MIATNSINYTIAVFIDDKRKALVSLNHEQLDINTLLSYAKNLNLFYIPALKLIKQYKDEIQFIIDDLLDELVKLIEKSDLPFIVSVQTSYDFSEDEKLCLQEYIISFMLAKLVLDSFPYTVC